jgi:hypothetical protein
MSPLSKLHELEPYIVVVDALDECDNDNNIRIIVQLLAEARSSLTSVPAAGVADEQACSADPHQFGQMADTERKDVVLHDIPPSIVDHDIVFFPQHHLQLIAKECHQADDWSGAETIGLLVQSASGLFLWPATACRFIQEGGQCCSRGQLICVQ